MELRGVRDKLANCRVLGSCALVYPCEEGFCSLTGGVLTVGISGFTTAFWIGLKTPRSAIRVSLPICSRVTIEKFNAIFIDCTWSAPKFRLESGRRLQATSGRSAAHFADNLGVGVGLITLSLIPSHLDTARPFRRAWRHLPRVCVTEYLS